MNSVAHRTKAILAMYVGLTLTVVATVVPYINSGGLLAEHVRTSYRGYISGQVSSAVTAYLVILTAVGFLGVICWLISIWAVSTAKRWAFAASIGFWFFAAIIALAGLTITDTSGVVGLAPVVGWIGTGPVLAGAVAVAILIAAPKGRPTPARDLQGDPHGSIRR